MTMTAAPPATIDVAALVAARRRRGRRARIVTGILAGAALTLLLLSVMLGDTVYSPAQILGVVGGAVLGTDADGAFTIGTLRMPRAVMALLAGFAFGLAGSTVQRLLRNPLASPDIIGITAGASAAAVFGILVLRWSGASVAILALVVGLLTAALILAVSVGSAASARIILVGIGIGAMLDAVVGWLLLRASSFDVATAMRWLSGSLNGMRWEDVVWLAVALALFAPLLLVLSTRLPQLELGDAAAIGLGVRASRVRLLLLLGAVALSAVATSATGPIAFVAFLAGPIASRLVGPGAPAVLPAGLTGATLVLLCDLLGQHAFDLRFPVGIITGIVGAPYLLLLLARQSRSGGSL
ncbi:FecCD family ABC transporter permease [Agrococcus sp. SGAir0287]|uniref:FecCD family ABC transporter permease n=1 Tax=Agrococcus sp. SGAir0287 TaxID=2070347 RepID=UPI0010CD3583|nr:iron chelate uptake ABC transporter family permease subunit [Agrococcus sp. SGAir0287]QCR20326.1 ABC transporter permease [Agrococcus sp. SGAir0287]